MTPFLRRHLKCKFLHVEDLILDAAIEEFMRFAHLVIANERFFFPCSQLVDDIWHALILETRDYAAMCEEIAAGKFLHHTSISVADYRAGKTLAEGDDEEISVLVDYVVNFGPFTTAGVKHWVMAERLMQSHGWSLDELNQFLDRLRSAALTADKSVKAPSDPRLLLLDFHAKHVGLSEDYFSAVKTSISGQNTYDIAASQIPSSSAGDLRILDVGCGSGGMFRSLMKRSNVSSYVGIDLSPDEIYLARRRIDHPLATFLRADAGDLPFKDGHFDVVISHMTLHLLEHVDAALAEIRRVLRPSGAFIFVVPARRNVTDSERAYSEIQSVFGEFKSSQAPLGTASFRTNDELLLVLAQVFLDEEPIVMDYQVCLEVDDASVFGHLRTMYPYATLMPEERPLYEAAVLKKLDQFRLDNPNSTLDRRMSVYKVYREKSDQ